MKRVLIALLMLVLMSVSISADGQYKVSIDGGLYGTPSDTEVTVDYNGSFAVDEHPVTVTNDKYYWKGYKIAGHDDYYPAGTGAKITITTDTELVACYGIPGNKVEYYIEYKYGEEEIASRDTFEGVDGDTVVIPFKYIEGYIPEALNGRLTIAEGKTYTFNYVPGEIQIGENGEIIYVYYDVPGAGGGAGGGGGGGVTPAPTPGGEGEEGGEEIPDEQTPQGGPDETIDIDDNETPQAEPENPEEGGETGGLPTAAIVGATGGAVGLLAVLLALLRKKKDDTEEE